MRCGMLDSELHSMYACSVFTLSARLSPELLSMCGNENFVFNVMRMDVDCVTDLFSQEQGSQGVNTTAAAVLCCSVVLDALFV